MKILIVDDEPNVTETLSSFLSDCGHTTVAAADGLQALEVMPRHGDIGLVIADVRMPRMDGIEFLTTIRVRFPGVPAILITGHGDEGLAVAALQEGATDYIKKPIKLRELRESVAKVEERHALESMILTGLERDPEVGAAAASSRTVEELKTLHQEIEGLGQLWEAVRSHLTVESDEEGERIVDFAVDEIPAAIARLRTRINELIKSEERRSGGLASLQAPR